MLDRQVLERMAGFSEVFADRCSAAGTKFGRTVVDRHLVSRFVMTAYSDGWILQDFDWPLWKHSDRGSLLLSDPSAVASSSFDEVRRAITTVVRQERFAEGSLARQISNGIVGALAARIAMIARDPASVDGGNLS